ncbi:MAG TPA: hypothetical protein VI541_00620 [Actinomycetota bacterium]|nr:hypothetical protein [Actinomycetota bacterium]
MLARLAREIPSKVEVDRAGGFMRLTGEPAEADMQVAIDALSQIGYEASRVTEEEDLPTEWFDAHSVIELSLTEADALADRWSGRYAEESADAATPQVRELLFSVISNSFKAAHGGGPFPSTGRIRADLVTRAASLPEEIRARFIEWVGRATLGG